MTLPTLEEILREHRVKMERLRNTLFVANGPVDDVANIRSVTWTHYVIGYKEAADLVFENLHKKGHWQDFLCYPIVFLYRQYVELELKRLTAMANYLNSKSAAHGREHHRLNDLWNDFEVAVKDLTPAQGEEVNQRREVHRLIKEFNSIDPSSQLFRYPVDTKGMSVSNNLQSINLRHLCETVDAIELYFNGWDGYLDEMISNMPSYGDD